MNPTTLADRVERADGASRELDAEIDNLLAGGSAADLAYILKDIENTTRPPHYTASIDSALTLVPEGWHATIHARPDWPGVELQEFPQPCRRISFLHAATPALAICAAALRAREKSDG